MREVIYLIVIFLITIVVINSNPGDPVGQFLLSIMGAGCIVFFGDTFFAPLPGKE